MSDDKAPYFVTVLVAATAWTFSHTVDRLIQTPFLKYELKEINSGDKQSSYINIKNITRGITYKNVNVLVTVSPKDTVLDGSVIPHQPAFEGNDAWTIAERSFSFTFPHIQPGWEFDVSVLHKAAEPVFIRFSTTDGQTFYAVRPSVETYLVEYELPALLLILGVGGLLLALTLWLDRRERTLPVATAAAVAAPTAAQPHPGTLS